MEDGWSNNGIGGNLADPTSVSSGNSDISGFSPGCSPGVLQVPESIRHAHQEHSQWQVGAAVVENTWFVELEVVSIHSRWDWSDGEGIGKGGAVGHIGISGNLEQTGGELAWSLDALVGISGPCVQSSVFNIVEREVHSSVDTSIVSIRLGAVNNLLDRVLLLGLVENDWDALNGSNCRECIGSCAWSLIFDWADSTISYPINSRAVSFTFWGNHLTGRWFNFG